MLHIGVTYPRILLGLILTDFLLTFIVPSGIARVVIMASIALGLAEAFKSGVGSNVSRGMFLILSYTANIFDKMIIAGAGSITARGLIEKVGGVDVLWSYWFIAFLPASIVTVLVADAAAVSAGDSRARRGGRVPARGNSQDGRLVRLAEARGVADRRRNPAVADRFRTSHSV